MSASSFYPSSAVSFTDAEGKCYMVIDTCASLETVCSRVKQFFLYGTSTAHITLTKYWNSLIDVIQTRQHKHAFCVENATNPPAQEGPCYQESCNRKNPSGHDKYHDKHDIYPCPPQ
jgi:hypothetical protein